MIRSVAMMTQNIPATIAMPSAARRIESEKELFDDLCERVATMTRREFETVKKAAEHLHFNRGITPRHSFS